MMSAVLVVMSGLPGAGKSAIADAVGRELGVPVLSVDPIEAAILRCGIPQSFETGVAAYEVARNMWRQTAARAESALAIIEVICSDENLHRERLASRRRDIPGFQEPSWRDVQARRSEWEPWDEDRLVLDTVRGIDAMVADTLDYLRR